MKNCPIGIFDSGVGGLTVLREVAQLLPHEDIIYFGDTARVPYGTKSQSTIVKFSTQNVLFLLEKKVKFIVVACNTSSALALNYLRARFRVPVIGVIEAGVEKALSVTATQKVAVIGTRSTINSGSYERQIHSRNAKVRVYAQACPLFVPLAEEGILRGPLVAHSLRLYLGPLKKKNIDTIVLGCTHYPLLKPAIARYLRGVRIVDSASEVAEHTKHALKEAGLLTSRTGKGKRQFFVSDEPQGFAAIAKRFLKKEINKPEVIDV